VIGQIIAHYKDFSMAAGFGPQARREMETTACADAAGDPSADRVGR